MQEIPHNYEPNNYNSNRNSLYYNHKPSFASRKHFPHSELSLNCHLTFNNNNIKLLITHIQTKTRFDLIRLWMYQLLNYYI